MPRGLSINIPACKAELKERNDYFKRILNGLLHESTYNVMQMSGFSPVVLSILMPLSLRQRKWHDTVTSKTEMLTRQLMSRTGYDNALLSRHECTSAVVYDRLTFDLYTDISESNITEAKFETDPRNRHSNFVRT
jgi:hypothetical protein